MGYDVKGFFDTDTSTVTFVVFDPATKDAVIIDPVLDYDPKSSQTSTASMKKISDWVLNENLSVHAILETHAHADHLSGAQILAKKLNAKVGIGEHIKGVQELFKGVFELPKHFNTDGSQFDLLMKEGEVFEAGSLKIETIHTPGHTPACVTYKVEDALFVGDVLFMHDSGTGRCDFPAGSSSDMYDSVQKVYAYPDETRLFIGHDYQPDGREILWETTVGISKEVNPMIRANTTREEFIKARDARDATLSTPRLLFQSVQVNIAGGKLPLTTEEGHSYLKIPVNLFRGATQSGIEDPSIVELEELPITS